MTTTINYKNLFNNFIGNSNTYALDVTNRIKQLFLYNNMGIVEEFMYSRNFYLGDMSTMSVNMVGIPNELIERTTKYYEQLKLDITAQTTTIQTQLNQLNPISTEKTYIKNVLLKTLESQLSNTMVSYITVINSLRKLQDRVIKDADKLNFITNNNYDGQFLDPNGGRVVAFQLTGTSVLNTLSTNYVRSTQVLNDFTSNYVNNKFTKGYPSTNEYLFFSAKIYTNDIMSFIFDGNYKPQLKVLLGYRDSTLYDELIKIDEKGVNGLRHQIQRLFKPKLNNIIKPWIKYDVNLMGDRINNGLDLGYKILDKGLYKYVGDLDVAYGTNTGVIAQNLVRDNLRSRTIGSLGLKFNFKLDKQLYIS